MSVSDPLIKELKGCTGKFLLEFNNGVEVNDRNPNLVVFCACLEKIFYNGIASSPNSFGFVRKSEPWEWLEKISSVKYDVISYSYVSSVENVQERRNVFTNLGRFRLLIRYCLSRKCLHVPIEYMLNNGKLSKLYYVNAILGDAILTEIFLSVLYQCGKLTFKFDLLNTSFLDLSWALPEVVQVQLVPTKNLGMSISFAGEKAVIIKMKANSVSSESSKIAVGDVLDTLNGTCISSATRGRLSTILKCQRGLPINLVISKAIHSDTNEPYDPIVRLYREIDLDPVLMKACPETGVPETKLKKLSSGFKTVYVGYVEVGRAGEARQIDKAFNVLLSPNVGYHLTKCKRYRTEALFEVGELGVKCYDAQRSELLLKNSFMEISACGSVPLMPQYFAYIAGEEYCNVAKNFKCFIFMAENEDVAYLILQGIGQGFQRTHFAV